MVDLRCSFDSMLKHTGQMVGFHAFLVKQQSEEYLEFCLDVDIKDPRYILERYIAPNASHPLIIESTFQKSLHKLILSDDLSAAAVLIREFRDDVANNLAIDHYARYQRLSLEQQSCSRLDRGSYQDEIDNIISNGNLKSRKSLVSSVKKVFRTKSADK